MCACVFALCLFESKHRLLSHLSCLVRQRLNDSACKRAILGSLVVIMTMFNKVRAYIIYNRKTLVQFEQFLHHNAIPDVSFVHNFCHYITIELPGPRSIQFSPFYTCCHASRTELQLLPSRMLVPFPSCQSSCRLAVLSSPVCTTTS